MKRATMRVLWVAFIWGCAFSAAAEPPADPPQITNPQWIERPTGRDFERHYPPPALSQQVNGRVVLECSVNALGGVGCQVASETPAQWGFAAAALAISQEFRIAPRQENGEPTEGGRVRIPISFRIGPEDWEDLDEIGLPDLPSWDDAPSAAAVIAATPPAQVGVRGRGVLSCRPTEARRLDCEELTETPRGSGFGAAALELSRAFEIADSEADFLERYRRDPFILPVNFGADPLNEPLSFDYLGVGPMTLPPAPSEVIETLYPGRARGANIEGDVMILCTVPAAGPIACAIESETPGGWSFGAVSLGFVQLMVNSAPASDLLEGDQLRFPLEFRLPAP